MKKLFFYPLTVIALIAAGQNLMGASNNFGSDFSYNPDNFNYDTAVFRVGQVHNGDMEGYGINTEEEGDVIKGILAGGEDFIKKILEVQKGEPTYMHSLTTVFRGTRDAKRSKLNGSGKDALKYLTEWANNQFPFPSTLDTETLKRWNEAMKAAGINTTFN